MRHRLAAGLIAFVAIAGAMTPTRAQGKTLEDAYVLVENFIRESYLASWFASPELIRQHFSDPVAHYWGRQNVPLRRVIKDKMAYVSRWPQRYYRMIGDSLVVKSSPNGDNIYAVKFEYEFETKRRGKSSSGLGETTLAIEIVDDDILILGEGGRVLERY